MDLKSVKEFIEVSICLYLLIKHQFQIDSTMVKQWMRRDRKLFLPGLKSHTGDKFIAQLFTCK